MSAGGSPGVELVLELVRDAARGRRCASCGRPLATGSVEPEDVDPERILARVLCACGAIEIVEVRPTNEDGRVEIR